MNVEFLVTFSTTVVGAVFGAYLTVRIVLAKLQSDYSNLKEIVQKESELNSRKFNKIEEEVKVVGKDISYIKGKIGSINGNLERLLNRSN